MSIDPFVLYPVARKAYNDMVKAVVPKTGNFQFIGKNMKRFDAYPKASGQAIYTRDVQFPGMLYAKILACPYPHASINSVDISKAQALAGVKAILKYDSTDVISPCTIAVKDAKTGQSLPLLPNEAKWEGEFVGVAVCAESEEICDAALKLLTIDWKQLPYSITADNAKKDSANLKLETTTKRNLILTDWPNYKEDSTYDVARGCRMPTSPSRTRSNCISTRM